MDDKETSKHEEQAAGKRLERNYNFNAPIGQFIEHVDTVNFRMDGEGNFHFGNVENVNKTK